MPGSGPRPARPATCARSWKVRSAAGNRQVEGDVGRDDRREGHGRQVQALRCQLGADQYVGAALAEVVIDRLEAAPRGERVRVEAADAQVPSANAPRPRPAGCPRRNGGCGASTGWAAVRKRGRPAAVVTAQRSALEVVHEGQIAPGQRRLSPQSRHRMNGGAAPVDEQHRLLAARVQSAERVGEWGGEDRPVPGGQLGAEIDDLDGRRLAHASFDEPRPFGVATANARHAHEVGVAVPSTTRAPPSAARRRATQRPS